MHRLTLKSLVFILLTTSSLASLAQSSTVPANKIILVQIIDLLLLDEESNSLSLNQELLINQFLESENGEYRLTLQADGNLVIRDWATREVLWSSETQGQNVQRVRLQGDGNLVLRSSQSEPIWSVVAHFSPIF